MGKFVVGIILNIAGLYELFTGVFTAYKVEGVLGGLIICLVLFIPGVWLMSKGWNGIKKK